MRSLPPTVSNKVPGWNFVEKIFFAAFLIWTAAG